MTYNKLYIFKEYNGYVHGSFSANHLKYICRAPTVQVSFSWQNNIMTAHTLQYISLIFKNCKLCMLKNNLALVHLH